VQWLCRWERCGQLLIGDVIKEHFEEVHPLPAKRDARVCLWEDCPDPLTGGIRDRSPWRHLRGRFHANLGYLKCPVEGCDKEFGRKDNLNRHLKNLHNVPSEVYTGD
jgi:hypothetical protein